MTKGHYFTSEGYFTSHIESVTARNIILLATFPLTNIPSTIYNFLAPGLVAQLGAHHIRIVGVGSSNLLKSTNE